MLWMLVQFCIGVVCRLAKGTCGTGTRPLRLYCTAVRMHTSFHAGSEQVALLGVATLTVVTLWLSHLWRVLAGVVTLTVVILLVVTLTVT
jgi:hypothetical protein